MAATELERQPQAGEDRNTGPDRDGSLAADERDATGLARFGPDLAETIANVALLGFFLFAIHR